jgi:hypothetical protein
VGKIGVWKRDMEKTAVRTYWVKSRKEQLMDASER